MLRSSKCQGRRGKKFLETGCAYFLVAGVVDINDTWIITEGGKNSHNKINQ